MFKFKGRNVVYEQNLTNTKTHANAHTIDLYHMQDRYSRDQKGNVT